jgi:histidinol-phosphate aminotransferase
LKVLSEQIKAPVEGIIKLDGNENPYGCSPKAKHALATYPYYHIYPDPKQRELREALAKYVGLAPSHIVAGNGSDELIDLTLRLFIGPGDKVINCVPTFGMYPFSTEVCGGRIVNVPRDGNFAIDIAKVKAAIDEQTKVIFLASPNNPTGNITPEQDILTLVGMGIVVVVDEAYYEFSGVTVAPLVSHYDNLIILRSFSKWAGLAGLRVGYGIFPQRLAEFIYKIKPPYNVNVAAQIAALESLKDIDYCRGTIKAIVEERQRLFDKLKGLDFIEPFPSQANFILCSILDGEVKRIHQQLKQRGIFIRYFDAPQLENCLRISVGKPEHTDALINAVKEIC